VGDTRGTEDLRPQDTLEEDYARILERAMQRMEKG
jgi:hypothetical protein